MSLTWGVGLIRAGWRLDRWYLQLDKFRDLCRQGSKQYYIENCGSGTSWKVVWEAQKACLRDQIISYVKGHREKNRQKIQDLEGSILDLEDHLASPPQDHLLCELAHMQTLLRQELTQVAREAWKTTRSQIYKWGDKASKTLHWLCTPRVALAAIPYLQMRDGLRVMGHGLMAQAFADYYQYLYRADREGPHSDLPRFVQDLPVSSLSVDDRASLKEDISVEELRAALAQLNPGRVFGLNGFPPGYWRLVWRQAGQPMLEMFQVALEMGKLAPDLQTTHCGAAQARELVNLEEKNQALQQYVVSLSSWFDMFDPFQELCHVIA
ncbi:hypothetical protein NDU88_008917 [Pleurodeles waltl]|uniref:Uncharacterized protein n=1 Tax=Pleurodeles waltl TaxID=8319 RepID=A0AAV7PQK0_PLEWA|nr:hypothetical protein NDU88_008917 [Pleurodeles waltl]